jgi:hypothetical protein
MTTISRRTTAMTMSAMTPSWLDAWTLAGWGKSDFGQLGSATDHSVSPQDPGTSERDAVIGANLVIARNRFSAAC